MLMGIGAHRTSKPSTLMLAVQATYRYLMVAYDSSTVVVHVAGSVLMLHVGPWAQRTTTHNELPRALSSAQCLGVRNEWWFAEPRVQRAA